MDEEVVFKAFVSSFNALLENKDHFVEKWKAEDGDELNRYKAREFIEIVGESEGMEEFDMDLYFEMVEKMTVLGDEKVVVSFLDGTEVECVWWNNRGFG